MINIHCVTGLGMDSNVYIVMTEKPIVIDTGTGAYTRRVIDKLNMLGVKNKIHAIVLTHRHIDHTGGALALVKELGCELYSSEEEAKVLRIGNEPSTCSFMAGFDLPALDIAEVGGVLDCGDIIFKIIAAPGHTAGHIVLYDEKNRSIFCGDVIFCDGGVGRWDLPTGNYRELVKSIEMLSRLKVNALYPGHGPYAESCGNDHIKLALDSIGDIQGLE